MAASYRRVQFRSTQYHTACTLNPHAIVLQDGFEGLLPEEDYEVRVEALVVCCGGVEPTTT